MFNFERLEVWQKSVTFAGSITKNFPTDERFGLTNQLRRAATSVSSNIAEGPARPPANFARFIGYVSGSLYEVISQVAIARNEGLVSHENFSELYRDAEEISRMLSGLRKALEQERFCSQLSALNSQLRSACPNFSSNF